MKFQVPQFVEVEDKIFGNLTLKQFIYIAGGAGLSVLLYLTLKLFIAVILIVIVMGFSLALAFFKYNNRPFIVVVENASKYLFNSKLYIWRKVDEPVSTANVANIGASDLTGAFMPKLSDSKLKDLNWSLDAKQAVNPVTKDGKEV